jgi:hypothetical protein
MPISFWAIPTITMVNKICAKLAMVCLIPVAVGLHDYLVINVHEGEDDGTLESGQGQAAALCCLAKRTLDAAKE